MSTVRVQNYATQEEITWAGETLTYAGTPVTFAVGDQTSFLLVDTLHVDDTVEGRSTATLKLKYDTGNTWELGQRTTISTGSTPIFGGIVDDLTEREDNEGRLWLTVKAVDYSSLLDRHRVAGAYENQTAGAILRDILTNPVVSTLYQEGLSGDGIEDGPVITRIVFNYDTATQAIEELAEYSGFHWNVTPVKVVQFRARDASAAPFTITDSSLNYRNLTVKRDKSEFRNRQLVRAGKDLTDPRTESFTGDGDTRTWTLAYPVGKVPTITLNSVVQVVGIQGLDTGKDYYWNKGSNTITQEDGTPVLTTSDTLAVTYQGLFPILVIAENGASQGARAAAEGTSGIYTNVVQDATLDDRDNAVTKAEALLSRFGVFNSGITFETDENREPTSLSLRAGDILSISKAVHNLVDDCLVESVSLSRSGGRWVSRVKALTGNQTMSWLRYWRALAEQQQGLSIRENEVVVIGGQSTSFSDTVDFADVLVATDAAPESRVGFLTIGFGEIG